MDSRLTFIETKLRVWRIARASNQEEQGHDLCNDIYGVLFSNELYLTIWDEPILLGLERLLDLNPPDEEQYGEEIGALRDRIGKVRSINDLFYRILEPEVGIDDVIGALSDFADLSSCAKEQLRSDGSLADIRKELIAPSQKIDKFMQRVVDELHVDAHRSLADIRSCVAAIQEREGIGVANVLLVHTGSNQGILLPINAKARKGSGRVTIVTHAGQNVFQGS